MASGSVSGSPSTGENVGVETGSEPALTAGEAADVGRFRGDRAQRLGPAEPEPDQVWDGMADHIVRLHGSNSGIGPGDDASARLVQAPGVGDHERQPGQDRRQWPETIRRNEANGRADDDLPVCDHADEFWWRVDAVCRPEADVLHSIDAGSHRVGDGGGAMRVSGDRQAMPMCFFDSRAELLRCELGAFLWVPGVRVPPLAMILMTSTPRSACSRTARRTASAPGSSLRRGSGSALRT